METLQHSLSDATKISLIAGSGIYIKHCANGERLRLRLSVKECHRLESMFPNLYAQWQSLCEDVRSGKPDVWQFGVRKKISRRFGLSLNPISCIVEDLDDDAWFEMDDYFVISLVSTVKEKRNIKPNRIIFSAEELSRLNELLPEICRMMESCYSVKPKNMVPRPKPKPPPSAAVGERRGSKVFIDYHYDFA